MYRTWVAKSSNNRVGGVADPRWTAKSLSPLDLAIFTRLCSRLLKGPEGEGDLRQRVEKTPLLRGSRYCRCGAGGFTRTKPCTHSTRDTGGLPLPGKSLIGCDPASIRPYRFPRNKSDRTFQSWSHVVCSLCMWRFLESGLVAGGMGSSRLPVHEPHIVQVHERQRDLGGVEPCSRLLQPTLR